MILVSETLAPMEVDPDDADEVVVGVRAEPEQRDGAEGAVSSFPLFFVLRA